MNEQSYLHDVQGTWGMRGFTMGVIVGAGIALLLAPAPGTDTRRKLGEAAKRIGHDARERLDRARHGVDQIKDQIKEEAKTAIGAGREAYTRSRQTQMGASEPGHASTTPGQSTRPI